ncbi:MAG: arylamine N-acetyltransferase [Micropepsaceae bacterium]
MKLDSYLERIGLEGPVRADLDTLRRIHRHHVLNIPYENLDVQFGRAVSRSTASVFDKIVERRRGGWCYEMNGLLGWALEQSGFRVTRMAGGVRRAQMGDAALGNHLVLAVHLDQDYLADTGFGDGLIEPVPIAEGPISQGHSAFALEDLSDGWWRFHGDPRIGGLSFDFQRAPADDGLLERQCQWLQSAPESPFVQNAVLQKHTPDGHISLRGCLFKSAGARSFQREVKSADEYATILKREFGLDLPEVSSLWPKIEARHREVFPNGAPEG